MLAPIICSTCHNKYGEKDIDITGLNIKGEIVTHGECGCRFK